jgi:hypothetical protein
MRIAVTAAMSDFASHLLEGGFSVGGASAGGE